jgi:hypothetical protein
MGIGAGQKLPLDGLFTGTKLQAKVIVAGI